MWATGILEMVYVQYERTWPFWGPGAGGQGAASECQKLLSFFFFSVLDKPRNCIQADGDRKINCVTRLVCRTWFRYHVAEMADLILNLRQADPHRLVDGRGNTRGQGPSLRW